MPKNDFSNSNKKDSFLFKKIRIFKNYLNSQQLESSRNKIDKIQKDDFDNLRFQQKKHLEVLFLNSKIEKTTSKLKITGYSKIQEIKLVKIGLASADKILEWSEKILPNGKILGEVLNANTLHYKTFKPHKGGLFCERIFGPLKDFECACGIKQKSLNDQDSIRNLIENQNVKRIFCPVCDVEYTWSVIRRYQLGYIKLASPVSHLWYLRTNPSYLSVLLDMKKRDLEAIVYCTQVTTLEYYWKPLNSLQLNLTASNLIESYKSYKKSQFFTKSVKNLKDLLQIKTNKKQKIELNKRENFKIAGQAFSLVPRTKTSNHLSFLENESLETKKMYLEKSFRLNSPGIENKSLKTISRVQNFLRKKVSKNLKKRSFFMIYSHINQRFYKEMFFLMGRKSLFIALNIDNPTEFSNLINSKKNQQFKTLPLFSKNLPYLSSVLKSHLIQNLNRKSGKSKEENFKQNPEVISSDFFWTTKNQYVGVAYSNDMEKNWILKQNNFSHFKIQDSFLPINLKEKTSLLALNNWLCFFKKNALQSSWDSVYNDLKNSIRWISKNAKTDFNQILDKRLLSVKNQNLQKTVQSFFFLYLLFLIQENGDSFLRNLPLKFSKERLTVEALFRNNWGQKLDLVLIHKLDQFRNSYHQELQVEFLSRFIQTNYLLHNNQKVQFFEVEEVLKNSKNQFLLFLKFLLNFIKPSLIRSSRLLVLKKTQKIHQKDFLILFQKSTKKELKFDIPNPVVYKFLNFQKNSEKDIKSLFHNLIEQKKFYMCLKGHPSSMLNFDKYVKSLNSVIQRLSTFKDQFRQDFNLKNNIYTVAYSNGWSTEKDWRYFLYYNIASIDIFDQTLSFYKNRFNPEIQFNNNFLNAVPIIGSNLILRLLFQYEGKEIRKMIKQNQTLLPKLNRYIRYLKELATKKSDFLGMQKLLQKRDQIIRRLKLLRKFVKKNVRPTSTILTILPVLPPDLRPILKMQTQIAASDLNRFYQRILYRNERLKKFLKANASTLNMEPGFEIKYAQRLLQESVDNLIQNGKGQVKPETNSKGQPLKSLSEILKGKQGRFRQYLLGKRVDYSGRSVIVVGPKLKLYQCGLPFEMALELFLPFLIKRIFQYKLARTVVGAKTILKTQKKRTWNLLEEIMEDHPILLNRAPTLHRLGIQAFQPKLIEGRAILLHPLVCPAFNADFDGDQMAVHLPITVEARTEAWKLMLSRNQLISPATGDPMLLPSQDMVLGCYYLTNAASQIIRFNQNRPFRSGTAFYFSNLSQVLTAYQQEIIHIQTPIWMKWNALVEMEPNFSLPFEIRLNSDGSWMELRSKLQRNFTEKGICRTTFVKTTAGRVLFNIIVENCIQESFPPKTFSN